MDLSIGLLECPQDMEVSFLQSTWSERGKEEAAHSAFDDMVTHSHCHGSLSLTHSYEEALVFERSIQEFVGIFYN